MSFLSVLMMQISDSPIFVIGGTNIQNDMNRNLNGMLIPFNYDNICLEMCGFQKLFFFFTTTAIP